MTNRAHSTVELLAPAGSVEAFRAALAAGADAIYLGLGELNARRGADNFTLETLKSACDAAHLRDRRVYLTANVALLPDDMAPALALVDAAWVAGVDAVIVQDLGLLRVLRSTLPEVRVHASTQINAHSGATIEALASVGVSRVTLSRETSIDEIGALAESAHGAGVEVESFVHGALCVCYSGQCLLSSLVGGRSANRGMCAQPCRLPYTLLDERREELADVGAHLLSPKDLAGITVLPALIGSGMDSLKIEGRMKSAEYVALVTGVYRAALDRALAAPEAYEVREGELAVLGEAFSRGLTEAYLIGERGNEMMSYRRPNNRGVAVGRVVAVTGMRATVVLDRDLDEQDTVELWTSQGRFAQRVGRISLDGQYVARASAGERVEITAEQSVGTADRVFRVRNAALSEAAARRYADEQGPEIPLAFSIRMRVGEVLEVAVADSSGRSGVASGPMVERARTRAVTADDIAGHVGRLGGTPYTASAWDIELSPDAGVGFSLLHATRRAALADYERACLAEWTERTSHHPVVPSPAPLTTRGTASRSRGARLVVAVSSIEAAEACLAAGADEAHVDAWALQAVDPIPAGVVPLVPRVAHDFERLSLEEPARRSATAVAGTLGSLRSLSSDGCAVQAHWSLNALNAHSVAALAGFGARFVWLSPELTVSQVRAVCGEAPVPVGVAVGGRQELMVTEHCVLMAQGECSRDCARCPRRDSTRLLKDRKGYEFPVTTDPHGRSHLYNAVPIDATAAVSDLLEAGVAGLRLDLETEGVDDAAAYVRRWREVLTRAQSGLSVAKGVEGATTGHFFRGVS